MADESWEHEEMVPAPAAVAAVRPLWTTGDGVILAYGTAANTVLEATDDTYASGCIYIKSLTAGTGAVYINVGTKASPDFNEITNS